VLLTCVTVGLGYWSPLDVGESEAGGDVPQFDDSLILRPLIADDNNGRSGPRPRPATETLPWTVWGPVVVDIPPRPRPRLSPAPDVFATLPFALWEPVSEQPTTELGKSDAVESPGMKRAPVRTLPLGQWTRPVGEAVMGERPSPQCDTWDCGYLGDLLTSIGVDVPECFESQELNTSCNGERLLHHIHNCLSLVACVWVGEIPQSGVIRNAPDKSRIATQCIE
jgi:hypothetical protein